MVELFADSGDPDQTPRSGSALFANMFPIYGIVRMCVPNGLHFQRCQVYD